MKKKVLATVLATAMVAASLVGCGGSSNETGGDSTPAADDSAAAQQTAAQQTAAMQRQTMAMRQQTAAAKPLNMVPARSRSGWLRTLLTLQMRKQQNSLQQILIWQVIRLPLNL